MLEWEASSDEKLLSLSKTVHRFCENFVKETTNLDLVSKVLGDIEGPDDVKKYKERAASEGIDTREPELSPGVGVLVGADVPCVPFGAEVSSSSLDRGRRTAMSWSMSLCPT